MPADRPELRSRPELNSPSHSAPNSCHASNLGKDICSPAMRMLCWTPAGNVMKGRLHRQGCKSVSMQGPKPWPVRQEGFACKSQ